MPFLFSERSYSFFATCFFPGLFTEWRGVVTDPSKWIARPCSPQEVGRDIVLPSLDPPPDHRSSAIRFPCRAEESIFPSFSLPRLGPYDLLGACSFSRSIEPVPRILAAIPHSFPAGSELSLEALRRFLLTISALPFFSVESRALPQSQPAVL